MRHNRWFTPYLFLLPYLLLFGGFVLLPAVYGVWISGSYASIPLYSINVMR